MLWEDAAIKNNGDYRICCVFSTDVENGVLQGDDQSYLNMRTHSVDSVRNHRLYKDARSTFLKGEWPAGCERCKNIESNGLPSMRTHRINRLMEDGLAENLQTNIIEHTQANGEIDLVQFPLREIDFRFNNRCNLKCRSCSPESSTSWYTDFYRIGETQLWDGGRPELEFFEDENKNVKAVFDRYDWSDGINVLDRLPKNLEKLSRIYFAGGEPLLEKRHAEFLKQLIAAGISKNIYLEYNTNLSVLTEETLNLWKEFKFIGVGVSMDGVGKFHEYVRFPSRFSNLERNLDKLDNANLNLRGWISYTVSILNVCHLPDAILWKTNKNYKNIVNNFSRPPISTRMLHHPFHLNLKYIPLPAKKYIEERLNLGMIEIRKKANLPEKKLENTIDLLQGIIKFMFEEDLSSEWPELFQKTLALDKWRNQSFALLEPELFALLEPEKATFRTEEKCASHQLTPQP